MSILIPLHSSFSTLRLEVELFSNQGCQKIQERNQVIRNPLPGHRCRTILYVGTSKATLQSSTRRDNSSITAALSQTFGKNFAVQMLMWVSLTSSVEALKGTDEET